jgi:hypothetical protein
MIVRKGITSFFVHRDIPEFHFDCFHQIVISFAKPMGFEVVEMTERGVTPNFHIATLTRQKSRQDETISILGHASFPIIAFAEPLLETCEIRFRDAFPIAARINDLFPHVTIATCEELSRKIEKSDLELLDRVEREQIKFWKPQTIGELAFNWWD